MENAISRIFRTFHLESIFRREDRNSLNMDSSVCTRGTGKLYEDLQKPIRTNDYTLVDIWTETGRRNYACGGNGGQPLPQDVLV
jgi:hypothetical protein